MSHRRTFLKQLTAIAGGAGLGGLMAADRALAADLADLPLRRQNGGGFAALRDRYLLADDVTYFNHGSIGTIPRAVQQAHIAYLNHCETNPWLYMWGGAWEETRQKVRGKAARYIGCRPAELAITHNTTEGFNTLASGLALGPGDDVLDAYDRNIGAATRVLVLPHVDNMVGLRHPVKQLAALAHDRGVEIVAVDGAQTVGMIDVDVNDLGVDVYCASPHKWLQSPKGLGLMYVRQEVQDAVLPMWVTWGQERWKGTARIYEDYGTRALAALLTLGDAIDFQEKLGAREKEARYRALWQTFRTAAESSGRVIWRSPLVWERSASLYALEIKGRSSGAVFDYMYHNHGFVFRPFHTPVLNTVRISPNVYNTEGEIERFFKLLPAMPGD